MTDKFENHAPGLSSPASLHAGITPNDSTDLDPIPRGIFVGGAGDITIRDKSGNDETYTIAAAPFVLPFRGVRVLSTGTNATNLIALYD